MYTYTFINIYDKCTDIFKLGPYGEQKAELFIATSGQRKVRWDCIDTWPLEESCCSVTKSCLTLSDPMDCSLPCFPVLHDLSEFAQTHVH